MISEYRAFISYSHKDAAHARWLHRKLETYRLPAKVRELDPSLAGGRLSPVFRDREDFPAADDLSASVRKALAASEALIVLCSPDARASQWVAREIELFRELHPDRPILLAHIRGEPAEAFPEVLTQGGKEPLAADFRDEGDGRKLGFLKIVAGLAGVSLDSLVQRDAQRRLMRVMTVTGAAFASALVLLFMTVYAIQARDEAQTQRAEAEGLVEYMLTDLRDELRGVGRLDVMDDVNLRAMSYYEGQGDLSDFPADSLERRARVLHAMGEDETYKQNRDLDRARAMFAEAHRTTEALLDREPRNPDRLFAHAQSQYWVGWIDELRGDYAAAEEWYRRYRETAGLLSQQEPGEKRALMEQAYGALNMGIMAFRQDRPDNAIERFEEAADWFVRVVEKDTSDEHALQELANTYAWIADVQYNAKEDYRASLAAQARAEEIKRGLWEADKRNMELYFDLLIAERAMAVNRYQLGEHEPALADLRKTLDRLENLSASDPQNGEWRELVGKTRNDLASLD